MKAWCDLTWREKCKIEAGDVSPLKYQTGYTFEVKSKVRKGIEKTKKQSKRL